MKTRILLLSIISTLVGIEKSQAATFYTDSQDWLDPIQREIQIGSNEINLTLLGDGFCPEFYTLIVPNGVQISSLNLQSYDSSLPGNQSFLGFQVGNMLRLAPGDFESPPANTDPSDLMIGDLRLETAALTRNDLLEDLTEGSTIGRQSTLGPGEYALWFNETGNASEFSLDFFATPIPEPSSLLLALLASFTLISHRNRSSQ